MTTLPTRGGLTRRPFRWIERHLEKLALGGSAAFLAVVGGFTFARQANEVEYHGHRVGPRELAAAIQADAAGLQQAMRTAVVTPTPIPPQRDFWKPDCGIAAPSRLAQVARTVAAPGPKIPDYPQDGLDPIRHDGALPRLVRLDTGRCVAVERQGGEPARDARGRKPAETSGEREFSWAAVTAEVSFDESLPSWSRRIAAIELQRQELLADESWSEWQDVSRAHPLVAEALPPALLDPAGRLRNRADLEAAARRVISLQSRLDAPDFPDVLVGDSPPGAASAEAGAAGISRPASRNAGGTVRVRALDREVVAGRTVRYRMRVRLANPYLERPRRLSDPTLAREAWPAGPWSQAGAAVAVASPTHVFVRGWGPDKVRAMVEVWKWHRGRWVSQVFAVSPGDPIGEPRMAAVEEGSDAAQPPAASEEPAVAGPTRATAPATKPGKPAKITRNRRETVDFSTGRIVVSVREELVAGWRGRSDVPEPPMQRGVLLTMVDPADGRVLERSDVADRADPLRRELAALAESGRERLAKCEPGEKPAEVASDAVIGPRRAVRP